MTPSDERSSGSASSLRIPLPTSSQTEASHAPGGERLGLLLLVLVSVLAFLLASFPARNSDLWLHLARGRLLVQEQSPSAADPHLAFDLHGNQTWLYDLVCYAGYRVVGGSGLVVAKALLAVALALLLLCRSRSLPGWCVPALCTSLALLTMSLHLLLRPATVSYLMLAFLLPVLRPRPDGLAEVAPSLLPPWPLVLLFVVWANVDRWFLLGLATVGLTWLGETLDQALAAGVSSRRWQSTLLRRGFGLLSLAAACSLNPSLQRAFALPADFHPFDSSAGQVTSPFQRAYFTKIGGSPAGLAYFLLLGLSLLSFAAVLSRWPWRRFLPWLGLALVSTLQVHAVPFFAVVAGAVLAWNVQEWLAHRFNKNNRAAGTQDARLGRALTVMLLLLLLLCAWPGWLETPPFGPRQLRLDLPPSLERGAAAVRRWREEGKLATDAGGLHLSAETVYAFAWYCPEDKRLRLTSQDAADEWRRRMRAGGINHVILYDTDRDHLFAALSGLLADAEQWPLLYQEGDLAIFGWRDPAQPGSADLFRGWQLDLHRLAFDPAEDKKAPHEASVRESPERHWWDDWWKAVPPRSIDREDALLYLFHAEILQHGAPLRHFIAWEGGQEAGLLAAAAGWTSLASLCDAPLRLLRFGPRRAEAGAKTDRPSPLERMTEFWQRRFTLQHDDAPPALYYLAVRAARRALAANPEDERAWLWLGESYLGLLHATRERAWAREMPMLLQLRQAQASAALHRAVTLRSDYARAHLSLGRLYQEMGYFDLALARLQTYFRLMREAGPPPGVRREDFQARQTQQEEELNRLARDVEQRENEATLTSAGSPVRERAFHAFQNGLAGKALDLLLESHLSAFGPEGMKLELELLLGVGRARDVREWLRPEHEADLGPVAYHWIQTRALAALGDYTRAEETCAETAPALVRIPWSAEPMPIHTGMGLLIAKLMLDEATVRLAPFSELPMPFNRVKYAAHLHTLANLLRQQAEFTVLRGLLALEEGESEEAESAFGEALALWENEAAAAAGGALDFNGRAMAQTCRGWLKAHPESEPLR